MTEHTHPHDARAREASKSKEEKAEDIAYTINHALSCGLTDIGVQPFASAAIDKAITEGRIPKWLKWVQNLFEKHDHDHEHHHDHSHHEPKVSLWENTKHWAFGEVLGDVGAVPLTIIVQRMFPDFMDWLRDRVEPIAGGAFRSGAERDARNWAVKHNYAPDSKQAHDKADALYEHEISHLPQAVVWNAFSIPINLGSQWLSAKAGHKPHWFNLVVGKTFGSLFSNTILLGSRAIAPEAVNEWDRFTSKNIIRPTLKTVGGAFGVDESTVDRIAEKEDRLRGDSRDDWRDRMRTRDEATSEQSAEAGRV